MPPFAKKATNSEIKPGIFQFTEKGNPYEALGMSQSLSLGFKCGGVKAYADTRIAMIPTSVPYETIRLNRPFVFDIVG